MPQHVRAHTQTRRGRSVPIRDYERRGRSAKDIRFLKVSPATKAWGAKVENVKLPPDAKFTEGEYMGGPKYLDSDKVVVNGIEFDLDTEFEWQNEDYLSEVGEYFAQYGGHPNWIEDYSAGEIDLEKETGIPEYYKFKAEWFRITEEGDVEISPTSDVPLGRVGLWGKSYYGGKPEFDHDISWRRKGEARWHDRTGEL